MVYDADLFGPIGPAKSSSAPVEPTRDYSLCKSLGHCFWRWKSHRADAKCCLCSKTRRPGIER